MPIVQDSFYNLLVSYYNLALSYDMTYWYLTIQNLPFIYFIYMPLSPIFLTFYGLATIIFMIQQQSGTFWDFFKYLYYMIFYVSFTSPFVTHNQTTSWYHFAFLFSITLLVQPLLWVTFDSLLPLLALILVYDIYVLYTFWYNRIYGYH